MATISKIEHGGWPSEIFEEGEEEMAEKLELLCPICLKVMREPTLIRCTNEHALCRTCADALARGTCAPHGQCDPCRDEHACLNARLKCPLDREFINRDLFWPAAYLRRRINELRVHCAHKDRGCGWIGDLGSFLLHTNECTVGHSVHVGGERCPGCACAQLVSSVDISGHENACRPCPYSKFGCRAMVPRAGLDAHMDTCACYESLVVRLDNKTRELRRQRVVLGFFLLLLYIVLWRYIFAGVILVIVLIEKAVLAVFSHWMYYSTFLSSVLILSAVIAYVYDEDNVDRSHL